MFINTKLTLFKSFPLKKIKDFPKGTKCFLAILIPRPLVLVQRWGAQSGRVAAPPELMRISTAQVRERPAAAERRLTRPSSLWSPEHGWKRYLPLPRAAAKNRVKPLFELTAAWRVKGDGGEGLWETPHPTLGGGAFTLLTFARRAADFHRLFFLVELPASWSLRP